MDLITSLLTLLIALIFQISLITMVAYFPVKFLIYILTLPNRLSIKKTINLYITNIEKNVQQTTSTDNLSDYHEINTPFVFNNHNISRIVLVKNSKGLVICGDAIIDKHEYFIKNGKIFKKIKSRKLFEKIKIRNAMVKSWE